MFDAARIETVLCDLDGVIWLAHEPIAGSVDAVERLRLSGRRVVFVTNNSAAPIGAHEAALAEIGIPAEGDVVSSAIATARLIEPGERVLVTGGPGIVEAVEQRGGIAVANTGVASDLRAPIDAVIVGLDRSFDYARLTIAAAALRSGARLIGTNSDPTYPTSRGLAPGGGSIVAAVATAGEATPVFGGKPNPSMAAVISERVARSGHPFDPAAALMVGDRSDTDGLMAVAVGCPFALVRSGATSRDVVIDHVAGQPVIAIDAADLAAVADVVLAERVP
jgi:4-nitrophenyl phosphatase